jgi:hypothetical protein
MDIQKVREAFERRQARNIPMSYEEFKQRTDEYEEITGRRYGEHSVNEREWIVWLDAWQAKAQAVPEGFVLVPTENIKYFSHDGENYEVHDTLAEAKHEAECAIESFRERLANQTCNPVEDGNFSQVGYGIVLAESGYSVDHIVTQEDIDNGEYRYEVGTEIMSLFLIEAQEPTND